MSGAPNPFINMPMGAIDLAGLKPLKEVEANRKFDELVFSGVLKQATYHPALVPVLRRIRHILNHVNPQKWEPRNYE